MTGDREVCFCLRTRGRISAGRNLILVPPNERHFPVKITSEVTLRKHFPHCKIQKEKKYIGMSLT